MIGTKAPSFWWREPDWRSLSLWPVSRVYGFVAARRMVMARREKIPAAILCVGNLTVGGEGKTPLAIALAREAQRQRLKVGFLSRGYGGNHSEPYLVDAREDTARSVGDEALLLARHAPTIVTLNHRVKGARCLVNAGCDFIILDDGFQSAHIHMDYALIVIDSVRGLGNGHVIPAGPLRAPLSDQLRFVDGIALMGKGQETGRMPRPIARLRKPVFSVSLHPRKTAGLKGARVLAFAGIGNPEKFYATLREVGAEIIVTRSFPDHYPYRAEDVADLTIAAQAKALRLVTTEKDFMRLCRGPKPFRDFLDSVQVLPVEALFDTPAAAEHLIGAALAAWHKRRFQA